MEADLLYKIALTKIPGVGNVTAKTLVSYCGSAREVFHSKKNNLRKIPGIGIRTADQILHRSVLLSAEKELEFTLKKGVSSLFYLDESYPKRLKPYPDSPVVLYYHGGLNLNDARFVSIIGTRLPSSRGRNWCTEIVEGLKNSKANIVSGLAYGIDVIAHQTALSCELPTVAVIGSGIDKIYPSIHEPLVCKMIRQGGVITEFGKGTKPDRENFPMRNRIIAGMCDAIVIIESGLKGGSMITANLANGYHKDVFAIPGRPGDALSSGCNYLIKNNQASLIESSADLVEKMMWDVSKSASIQKILFTDLEENEKMVFNRLREYESCRVDDLAILCQKSVSQLAPVLLSLECKGLIRSAPGHRYFIS